MDLRVFLRLNHDPRGVEVQIQMFSLRFPGVVAVSRH